MTRRNGLTALWLSVFFLCSLGAFRAGLATPAPHTAWRALALSSAEQPQATVPLARPQYNIRDLGAIYFTGSYPGSSQGFDINDSDQVVGTSGTISGSDAFLWDPAKGLFDLGTLGGYSYSYTAGNGQPPFRRSVNGAGQVAGYSYEYGPLGSVDVTTNGIRHAYRWDGTFGMQDLGALFTDKNGYSDSLAYGISDLGDVVGDSTASGGYTRGFLWTPNSAGPGGTMADLGSLTGAGTTYSAYYTHAAGINGKGQVTGNAYTNDGTYHAFLYGGGQMYDIGPAGKYSQGYAINDAGQVAGLLGNNDGFLWTPAAPNGVTGASVDIGPITTVALNARGQIAGTQYLPGVNQYVGSTFPHATLWTPNTDPTSGGTATDLGLLQSTSGYGSSQALAISGNGQVVGYASNSHAFVYRDGLMYDLNNLLTGSGKNGWTLTSANAINTQGDITGYGYLNGYTHAFLLTAAAPAAAPAPALSALSPNQAIATHPAFTLEVNGVGFALGSVVHWKNDVPGSSDVSLASTVESDSLIRATVPASLIAAPGTATVTVTNTDGQTSGPQTFTILAPNPLPTITAITPPSVPAGSAATKVVITGTNFLSKALGDSFDCTTSFYSDYYGTVISAIGTSAGAGVTVVSHTEIDVTVPAADMVDGSLMTVTVSNPAPDGGSATGKFSVVNPTPAITGFAPPSVGQNSPAFTLTVQGTGFEPSSTVYWQGPKGDVYGGSFNYLGGTWDPAKPGQVTVKVDAAYLTTAGTAQIKVNNNTSGGGGGDSASVSYTVTASGNPVPTIDHIKPIGFGYHWPYYYSNYPLVVSSKASDYVGGASVFFGPDQVASVTVASDHTSITANLTDALIAKYAPGTVVKIKVHNPSVTTGGTDGGDSGTADFTVGNPRPEPSSVAPTGILMGSASTAVTVTGTGFIAGTTGTTQVVFHNPSGATTALTPTVNAGGTQLTVTVPSAALTTPGYSYLAFTNAPILASDSTYGALDGGTSTQSLPVTVPAATLTAISPVAGIAKTAQPLTLTGTGFLAKVSTVYFSPSGGGTYSYAPDSVSADGTTLTVTIPAGTVTPVGDAQVAVYQSQPVSPAGAVNPTASLPFTIQAAPNPKPTNVTLSPATVEAGHDGFTMTVSASGLAYNVSSPPYVSWDGAALKTATFNRSGSSLTSMTVQVPPALVASVGTHQVTVTNPPPYVTAGVPASSTSDPVPFVVTAGPQITTLSPSQATAGGPGFTLDIQGSGFENGVSVFWNGGFRATTYYSDTHIAAAVTASDIAAVGTATVQAVNPPPGGGKSNLVNFAVVAPNPAPTLTGLSPASAAAGAASFTLTLTGTGFLPSSTVQFGSDTLNPTGTVTPTQVAVAVPAADVAQPGPVTVTVTDPAPGGGQSGPQTFTVTTPTGPPPPPAPTLTSATAVSSSEIDLVWAVGSAASGSALPAGGGGGPITGTGNATAAVTYNVKRSLTPGGPYQTVPPPVAGLSDADTGLQPATTYYYVVSAVSGTQESPNSNEKSATTPSAPQANLAPTSLTFPNTLAGGQSASVSWAVQDTGLGGASGSWSDTLYFSAKNTLDGSAVSLGTFAAPSPLAAGASYTQTQTVTLPTSSAGSYYLIVVADSAKSLPEATYDDNTLAVPVTLLHNESLVVTPDQATLSVTPGTPAQGQLTLTNLGGTALTGLTVTPQGAAPNVTVSLSPPTSLDPHAAQTVTYTVTAADLSTPSDTVTLDFKTAGGDDAKAVLSVAVLAPQPHLVVKPTSLTTGMLRGQTSLAEIDVTNTGTQAAKGLRVVVPQAPWLALATPALIGDLAPGATAKVLLSLMPAATLPLGTYSGSVIVYGSNAQIRVPASFNCTSTAKGDLTVTAQDEYTFFADGHPGVAGATVTLTDVQTGAVVLTGVTDGTGTFVAHGVTQATYNVMVSAPKHRTYHNGLVITPGINNPVQAYLPIQLVTYTFSVVPVNTPAQYQVTLDATFETHVPAPVVTVSPALLNLNQVTFDKNGQAVVNYTFTNHGLIAANNTTLQFPATASYTITPAVPNIGTLAPGETVTVPVLFSPKAAAGALRPNDLSCGTVTAHVFWEFVCGGVREDSGDMYISYGSCINTGAPYTDLQTTLAQIELDPQPHNFPLPFGPVQPDDPLYGPPTVLQDTPCQLNVGVGAARPAAAKPADAPPSGICARVKLQFDQDVVLTRTAFRATLDLMNDPLNVPLQNVQITLSVLDASQRPTKGLFAIGAPALSGVDAVDGTGTIAPGGDGNVQWMLLPTHGAAPLEPTQYYVGGTISYLQGGTQFTIPIFPTPILVEPDPSLQLHYFLQHNVYAPDPRVPDLPVLPEPFSLGLLVVNTGGGTAHDMTITTAQPQLVDNQKGLAITFNLVGSQVNGQAITPSFQTSLGDILPGGTATADWLLTSSLPGQFLSFDASFKDVNDLGNPQTSLIDGVDAHALIHVVRVDVPSDDGKPDFLTEEQLNADDLPDTVWLSDGTTSTVTDVTGAAASGPPAPADGTVQLTLPSTPTGYTFVRLDDPAPGQFPTKVVRADGRALRLGDNVWTTSRVVALKGQTPYVQHRLYLFDVDPSATYTLTYAPLGGGTGGGTGGGGTGGGTGGGGNGQTANGLPAIGALSPSSAPAGTNGLSLTVSGVNFVSGSAVLWNGLILSTTFQSSATLIAAVTAADLADPGAAVVSVLNPDGSTAAPVGFNIGQMAAAGPPPPATKSPVALVGVSGVTRSGGQIALAASLYNGSGTPSPGVALTSATLGGTGAVSLPAVGDLPPGQFASVPLTFPDTGAKSGTLVFLQLKGTFGGGQFNTSLRVPLP